MAHEPPEVFNIAARQALFESLLAARGIIDDTTMTALTTQINGTMAQYGSHVVHSAQSDPDALRYAAAAFELWARSCDLLARYADDLVSEQSAVTVNDLTLWLRQQTP